MRISVRHSLSVIDIYTLFFMARWRRTIERTKRAEGRPLLASPPVFHLQGRARASLGDRCSHGARTGASWDVESWLSPLRLYRKENSILGSHRGDNVCLSRLYIARTNGARAAEVAPDDCTRAALYYMREF